MNAEASTSLCFNNGVATLQCIPHILNNLIFWLFGLVGIVAVIFVIYGGARFVLSGGDEKQIEGARKTITYALIGLILVILAFAIINFISYITGVGCIGQLGIGACMQ